jgi:hypothetical protein
MKLSQGLALGVLAAVMVLFLWGRLRYDIVAALGLAAGTAVGVVPAETAFSGFSDDIVIIIASALVVSAAIARSGALEAGLQMLAPWLRTQRLGSVRRGVLAVSILAVAMGATAFGVVPVTLAFAGAALAMMLSGELPLSPNALERPRPRSRSTPMLSMAGAPDDAQEELRWRLHVRRHSVRGARPRREPAHLLLQDVPASHGSADGQLGRVPERERRVDGAGRRSSHVPFITELQPGLLPNLRQRARRDRRQSRHRPASGRVRQSRHA